MVFLFFFLYCLYYILADVSLIYFSNFHDGNNILSDYKNVFLVQMLFLMFKSAFAPILLHNRNTFLVLFNFFYIYFAAVPPFYNFATEINYSSYVKLLFRDRKFCPAKIDDDDIKRNLQIQRPAKKMRCDASMLSDQQFFLPIIIFVSSRSLTLFFSSNLEKILPKTTPQTNNDFFLSIVHRHP